MSDIESQRHRLSEKNMGRTSFLSAPADPERIAVARGLLYLLAAFSVIVGLVDALTDKLFLALTVLPLPVVILAVFTLAWLKKRPAMVLHFAIWLQPLLFIAGSVQQAYHPEIAPWGIIYPFIFYHLAGLRTGTFLSMLGIVTLFLAYLACTLAGDVVMPPLAFAQYALAFIFSAVLAWLYERIRTRQADNLIQDQKQLEALVEKRTAESTALYRRLDSIREEQAMKVGRELHDELGGVFFGLKTNQAILTGLLEKAGAEEAILVAHERSLELINNGFEAQRRIVNELRPPLLDELGIASAIEWHVDEFCHRTGIACETSLYDHEARLESEVSLAFYRILQEALTNVAKHAKATQVWVTLHRVRDEITLGVRDNGKGLPSSNSAKPQTGSHGLRSMQERARQFEGRLFVSGSPGHGTQIEVTIPITQAGAA